MVAVGADPPNLASAEAAASRRLCSSTSGLSSFSRSAIFVKEVSHGRSSLPGYGRPTYTRMRWGIIKRYPAASPVFRKLLSLVWKSSA